MSDLERLSGLLAELGTVAEGDEESVLVRVGTTSASVRLLAMPQGLTVVSMTQLVARAVTNDERLRDLLAEGVDHLGDGCGLVRRFRDDPTSRIPRLPSFGAVCGERGVVADECTGLRLRHQPHETGRDTEMHLGCNPPAGIGDQHTVVARSPVNRYPPVRMLVHVGNPTVGHAFSFSLVSAWPDAGHVVIPVLSA